MEVLMKICKVLKCNIGDIMDLIPIENETGEDDEQAVMLQSKLLIRKSCGNRERLREIW